MKKNIFIFSVFFIFCFSAHAQDSLKKIKIGIDLSFGDNALGENNLYPAITFSTKKHSFFAGPVFIYLPPYNKTYAPSVGFHAGYQFYPWGHKHRFNLFFEYDLSYIKAAFQKTSYYYTPSGPALPEREKVIILAVDSYVGAGCRFNIFKWLYLKLNAGAGIVYYDEDYLVSYNNSLMYHHDFVNAKPYVGSFQPFSSAYIFDENYNYMNHKHIVAIVKLGIGITF